MEEIREYGCCRSSPSFVSRSLEIIHIGHSEYHTNTFSRFYDLFIYYLLIEFTKSAIPH
jgi:hypothetical protein